MERLREVPPLIRELKAAGFAIRIRRHQSNEAFTLAMVDAIEECATGRAGPNINPGNLTISSFHNL